MDRPKFGELNAYILIFRESPRFNFQNRYIELTSTGQTMPIDAHSHAYAYEGVGVDGAHTYTLELASTNLGKYRESVSNAPRAVLK